MSVSSINSKNVLFSKAQKYIPATSVKKEEPENKANVKKALAIASAAAAAIGIGLIAVGKIKNGKVADLPKDFALGQENIKKLVNLKGLQKVNQQIADVASRTKKGAVGERMADLAEAFGGVVKHIPQKASIVG